MQGINFDSIMVQALLRRQKSFYREPLTLTGSLFFLWTPLIFTTVMVPRIYGGIESILKTIVCICVKSMVQKCGR